MGKEAKIGLAVVLVLLITFGVVLARRLTTPADKPAELASGKNAQDTAKTEGDRLAGSGKSQSAGGGAGKLTMVGAGTVSDKTLKLSPNDPSRWSAASAAGTTQQSTAPAGAKASLRSYMPQPSLPPPGGLPAQYQNRLPAAAAAPNSQAGRAGTHGSAAGQAYDPFQNFASQTVPAKAASVTSGTNTLRVMPSPPTTAARAAADGYGYPHSGTYAPSETTTARMPVYPPNPRPDYPAASVSTDQHRQIAVSSVSAGIGPAYGTGSPLNEKGEYKVQPNDSYWVISQKLYGVGGYFKALAEHNLDRVPQADRLAVGDVILAPTVSELEKAYPGLCPKPGRGKILRDRVSAVSTSAYAGGRTYVVQEGDTLFDIARYELGKASRWPEIVELNRAVLGDDHDYLSPGQRLALPDDGPVDTVTGRPGTGATFRR